MNDSIDKNEGAGQAFAIIIGAIVLIVLLWVGIPRLSRINIAPDNNAVNINGDQRKELDEMGK